jgi:hypothetical protein
MEELRSILFAPHDAIVDVKRIPASKRDEIKRLTTHENA